MEMLPKRLFETALVVAVEYVLAMLEEPLHLRILLWHKLDNERPPELPKEIGDRRQGHIVGDR
jgi:hypothetical protein